MATDDKPQKAAQEIKDLTQVIQSIDLGSTAQNDKYMTDTNGNRIEYDHAPLMQRSEQNKSSHVPLNTPHYAPSERSVDQAC